MLYKCITEQCIYLIGDDLRYLAKEMTTEDFLRTSSVLFRIT